MYLCFDQIYIFHVFTDQLPNILARFQLAEVRQEASQTMMKLRQVETELTASKQRCEDQGADLIKKSGTDRILPFLLFSLLFNQYQFCLQTYISIIGQVLKKLLYTQNRIKNYGMGWDGNLLQGPYWSLNENLENI
jgi:hypothetical protein